MGFRKLEKGGTWIARAYDAATRKRNYHALTSIAALPANEQFTQAVKKAREWFDHLERGGSSEVLTVAEAATEYLTYLAKHKGEDAEKDARHRVQRLILNDPIGKIDLRKLSARHVGQWRDRLLDRVIDGERKGQSKKKHSDSSLNRDMVALRATLNHAKSQGYVTSDMAWREKLKPIKNANGRRNVYLDRKQRRALVDSVDKDMQPFVHALCLLPLRPGAMAELRVGDFDARAGTLTISSDKAGAGRTVLLPDAAQKLLAKSAKNKLPTAHMFTRGDGAQWHRDMWKKAIKKAAAASELPPDATLYTLRHSTITDLVVSGLDLFTVAALSGTSIAMIEKQYGHLQQERAQKALETLSI